MRHAHHNSHRMTMVKQFELFWCDDLCVDLFYCDNPINGNVCMENWVVSSGLVAMVLFFGKAFVKFLCTKNKHMHKLFQGLSKLGTNCYFVKWVIEIQVTSIKPQL